MVAKNIILGLMIVFLFGFLFINYAAAYTFVAYGLNNESFYTSVSCNYNLTGYINTTGAKLNYTSYFYSPDYTTNLGFSTRELSAGNCQYMGQFSATGSNTIHNTFNTTPAPVENYLKVSYDCNTAATNNRITLKNNATTNLVYAANTFVAPVTDTETICDNIDVNDMLLTRANWGSCSVLNGLTTSSAANVSLNSQAIEYYYPFRATSQYANLSYYALSDAAASTRKIAVFVYDMDNTSTVMYNTTFDSTGGFSGLIQLNALAQNHDYVIGFCEAQKQAAAGWFTRPNLTVDVLDLTPNWNCSAYSDCIDNYRTRYCNDLNGAYPNKNEISVCSAIKNATIGFENYTSTDGVSICVHDGWWDCYSHKVANITVDRPTGWTVADPVAYKENFLRMSSDWATEGSRSLQIWYIPPKINEINGSNSCGNTTVGKRPQIFQYVNNTSMYIMYNVSFPSSYMSFSYDVKTCYNPVEQYGVYQHLVGNCPAQCYGPFCNSTVRGKYYFDIRNETSLFGNPIYDDITYWGYDEGIKRRYELFNVEAGKNYEIIFAVDPQNNYDTNAYCVYLDNVQYSELAEPLSTDCFSRCDGTTRIQAETINGGCSYTEIYLSPLCISNNLLPYFNAHETYCDGTTKYYYVNGSGWKSETDATFCSSWLSEQTGNINSFTDEDLDKVLNFAASPLLWAMLIALIIGGAVFYLTKSIEGFIIGFAVGVFLMWSLGFIPSWLIAIIVIIAVLLFAAKFKGAVGGV